MTKMWKQTVKKCRTSCEKHWILLNKHNRDTKTLDEKSVVSTNQVNNVFQLLFYTLTNISRRTKSPFLLWLFAFNNKKTKKYHSNYFIRSVSHFKNDNQKFFFFLLLRLPFDWTQYPDKAKNVNMEK